MQTKKKATTLSLAQFHAVTPFRAERRESGLLPAASLEKDLNALVGKSEGEEVVKEGTLVLLVKTSCTRNQANHPGKSNSSGRYDWKVSLEAGRDFPLSRLIKKVSFCFALQTLPVQNVNSEPFSISCETTQSTDVRIRIQFQRKYKRKCLDLHHTLETSSLNSAPDGREVVDVKQYTLSVDDSLLQQFNAEAAKGVQANLWKSHEVIEWLKHNQLDQYAPQFKAKNVDGYILSTLSDTDLLNELQIDSRIARLHILRAFSGQADRVDSASVSRAVLTEGESPLRLPSSSTAPIRTSRSSASPSATSSTPPPSRKPAGASAGGTGPSKPLVDEEGYQLGGSRRARRLASRECRAEVAAGDPPDELPTRRRNRRNTRRNQKLGQQLPPPCNPERSGADLEAPVIHGSWPALSPEDGDDVGHVAVGCNEGAATRDAREAVGELAEEVPAVEVDASWASILKQPAEVQEDYRRATESKFRSTVRWLVTEIHQHCAAAKKAENPNGSPRHEAADTYIASCLHAALGDVAKPHSCRLLECAQAAGLELHEGGLVGTPLSGKRAEKLSRSLSNLLAAASDEEEAAEASQETASSRGAGPETPETPRQVPRSLLTQALQEERVARDCAPAPRAEVATAPCRYPGAGDDAPTSPSTPSAPQPALQDLWDYICTPDQTATARDEERNGTSHDNAGQEQRDTVPGSNGVHRASAGVDVGCTTIERALSGSLTSPSSSPPISSMSWREALTRTKASHEIRWEELEFENKSDNSDPGAGGPTLLGSGGYGKVYLASWNSTPVAVKVLHHLELQPTEKQMKEFKREVEILASLHHPNVVLWMGTCVRADNPLALVTEPIFTESRAPNGQVQYQGRSLHYMLHKRPSVQGAPTNQPAGTSIHKLTRLKWALDVVLGMVYLHGKCVCHLDLNANNVLITKGDVAKITDFGLSKARMSTLGVVRNSTGDLGTVAYQAPERMTQQEFDGKKADVFSFGVMLYELATGRVPWAAKRTEYVLCAVANNGSKAVKQELEFPEEYNAWRDLAYKCWEDKPELRPSFEEVHKVVLECIKLERQVARAAKKS
ncbi:hypothetical protein CYMTET_38948 [Cymbomonas tetramitiformis]|uniref:Protein kinase domain-containing protein n=1 Tax=Cymbomonas tetramitiformis TaxID=36881 RepID=A0AAE0CD32_9CHLO|nr:hypothetical protein CYMTET_38948 [Cymbomonas tetramitiformis]